MAFLAVVGGLTAVSGLVVGGAAAYHYYVCFVSKAGGPCSGLPLMWAVLYAGPALLIGAGLLGVSFSSADAPKDANVED